MAGRMAFDFQFSKPTRSGGLRPDAESPMRILILGDFSWRAGRVALGAQGMTKRRPVAVDLDHHRRGAGWLRRRARRGCGASL